MRGNVKNMRGIWKLMYEGECKNYYKRSDVKINVLGGMWKLMNEGECKN
jgi:hypothetical protein